MGSLLRANTDLDTSDMAMNKTGPMRPPGAYLSSGGRKSTNEQIYTMGKVKNATGEKKARKSD